MADTTAEQAEVEAAALPTADGAEGTAQVLGSTVIYDRAGSVASAPIVAVLEDGRRVVAQASPAHLESLAGKSLIGESVRVSGSPLLYDL